MSRSRIRIGPPEGFRFDQPRASLGFKVIKSLLGQLDGRITVSSNQPKGAAIQLDLPLDPQSLSGTRPSARSRPPWVINLDKERDLSTR